MLIPAIDLKGGRVVQLVQGRDLALASDDLDGWIAKFSKFPVTQVIDLDGAMETGGNLELVRYICSKLTCRVGGGIRTPERARLLLDAGASAVIASSALFVQGQPDAAAAQRFASAIGAERLLAAVDSLNGRVVVRGWKEATGATAVEAVKVLEPHCSGFLYTHVDTEGLMKGIDLDAVKAVRAATTKSLTAAGGISTQSEIDTLHAMGIDAVVGMAVYTGALAI